MKRLLSLLLCLSTILSLCACSTRIEMTDEEQETATETAETKYPVVKNPLTWEKIREIPIANSSMSVDELRKICTDYFRLQLTFEWTPEKTFDYTITSYGNTVTVKAGNVYGGCLYVTGGVSNLYRVMNHYDPETGILKFSRTGDITADAIGNQCSYGSFWGWARVSNSFTYTLTETITEANGAIPLGPYKAEKARKHESTKQVCQENGREIMYQSYACLKPADGMVCYSAAGHVRMASSEAVVFYNEDGTIDGNKSYVLYLDQVSRFTGKDNVFIQGGVDRKATFAELYRGNYVPFTFKEFLGTDPVEDGEISVHGGEIHPEMRAKEIAALEIKANYTISDVTTTLTAEDGTVLYNSLMGTGMLHCYDLKLNKVFFPTTVKAASKGANETLKLVCRLGTGEEITIYEGKALF